MAAKILTYDNPVTLLGGGERSESLLRAALARAPNLVAADGGANDLSENGPVPDAIIGDLDSLGDVDGWRRRLGDRLIHIAEQDTTDFEKCLMHIDAPLFIGVGFLGGRHDHALAALHALISAERPVLLLGPDDIAFAGGHEVEIELPVGARFSIFPMRAVTSYGGAGLKWPLDGLAMEAGGRIGTSNEVASQRVKVAFDRPGAVVMIAPDHMDAALSALSRRGEST